MDLRAYGLYLAQRNVVARKRVPPSTPVNSGSNVEFVVHQKNAPFRRTARWLIKFCALYGSSYTSTSAFPGEPSWDVTCAV